jgi:hypothetical protein
MAFGPGLTVETAVLERMGGMTPSLDRNTQQDSVT